MNDKITAQLIEAFRTNILELKEERRALIREIRDLRELNATLSDALRKAQTPKDLFEDFFPLKCNMHRRVK